MDRRSSVWMNVMECLSKEGYEQKAKNTNKQVAMFSLLYIVIFPMHHVWLCTFLLQR